MAGRVKMIEWKKTTEQHVFCEVDEHRGESTQSDVIQLRLRLKLSVR